MINFLDFAMTYSLSISLGLLSKSLLFVIVLIVTLVPSLQVSDDRITIFQ
jgi:hypothetical protein